MKKKIALILSTVLIGSFFSGCGIINSGPSIEDQQQASISLLQNEVAQMKFNVDEMKKDIDVIKKTSVPPPTLQANDLIFTSARIVSPDVKTVNGKKMLVYNPAYVKSGKAQGYNLKVDIYNTTGQDLTQYNCDVLVKYYSGDTFKGSYSVDMPFNIRKKDFRKGVELKGIPLMTPDIKQTLTFSVKDLYGNVITTTTLDVPLTN